jgi:hypothetical protein
VTPTPSQPAQAARLRALQAVRAHLERVWALTDPPPSATAKLIPPYVRDRHACVFLQRLFKRCGETGWECAGGTMGTAVVQGITSHWWLERGEDLADLTADIYGHPPVVLSHIGDPRYTRLAHLSKARYLRGLTRSVLLWEGEGATFDKDFHLGEVAASYRELIVHVRGAWARAPLDSHRGGTHP